jgi:hypothetical protein
MKCAASSNDLALLAQEDDLCTFYIAAMVEARRSELRALYEIAGRLHAHKARIQDGVRESLKRCGRRLGKDRTTLLRYAFVYQRIKAHEFDILISLSDARGFPPTFWDLVEVAERSREMRLNALIKRLAEREVEPKKRRRHSVQRQDGMNDAHLPG